MIASVDWKKECSSRAAQSGHAITFDATAEHASGLSPMEAVLAALCACTSVDVVSILQKKREPITGLTVSANAEQSVEVPRLHTFISPIASTARLRRKPPSTP